MKKLGLMMGLGLSTALSSAAFADGMDRASQSPKILYEKGNYAEISYFYVMPSLKSDSLGGIPNIGKDYDMPGIGVKLDVTDSIALAFQYSTPAGSDIVYNSSVGAGIPTSKIQTNAYTLMGKYQFSDNISVYAGAKYQTLEGTAIQRQKVDIGGTLTDVNVTFDLDQAGDFGFLAGAAYEIPQYAMRFMITYHSKIEHNPDTYQVSGNVRSKYLDGVGTGGTPQAIEIEVQSGITQNLLVFGGFRWSDWSDAQTLLPGGTPASSFEDVERYTLGLGYKVNEDLSLSLTGTYEPKRSAEFVKETSVVNGRKGLSLGAKYKLNDHATLSGGINYAKIGDAITEKFKAEFNDSSAFAFGAKLGYSF